MTDTERRIVALERQVGALTFKCDCLLERVQALEAADRNPLDHLDTEDVTR